MKLKDKKTVTIPEYAKSIGKSRQWVFTLVRRGDIKATKVGRDWLIEV